MGTRQVAASPSRPECLCAEYSVLFSVGLCVRWRALGSPCQNATHTRRSFSLQVFVTAKPGDCFAPDSVMQVVDEGMPVAGHTQIKGVLLVKFEVVFPEHLEISEAAKKVLGGILPGPASVPKLGPGMIPAVLEEADMEARKARERLAKDAYDEEEEGSRGGAQQVQCAQQ